MTSKLFFFRVMKEDMRHRTWMAALSILGSFLAVLVAWLLWEGGVATFIVDQNGVYVRTTPQEISSIAEFFSEYLAVMGGVLTIAGALIVGLFGFRYIFHRSTMDTYQSLPVKRNVLFGAVYVNGILIWFVPFFVFLLAALVKASFFWSGLGGTGEEVALLWKEAALTLAVLTVVFLLVYNLVLVAAMLSGNVLNTLVSMMILGFVVVSVWVIFNGFCESYFDFFYTSGSQEAVIYASPLVSAPVLLSCRLHLSDGSGSFWELCGKYLLPICLVTAALGLCAWFLYRRRASELAGQGIRNRLAAALLRVSSSVVAGMGGWMIFSIAFSNDREVGWGIFGAVFGSVLVFGVLDIVFHMEFRAFLAHKLQMGATVVFLLLACFAIRWDWFGYDRYLPAKDQIAEIALWGTYISGHFQSLDGEGSPLDNMSIRDVDAIYSYLERMTDESKDTGEERDHYADSVVVKVTLTSGRSYYRRYSSGVRDVDVLLPLLATEEYVKQAYCVDEEAVQNVWHFSLFRSGQWSREWSRDTVPENLADIIQAYNQDVLEDPEGIVAGRGKMLTRMEFSTRDSSGYSQSYRMNVYNTMERTVDALRNAGLSEWVDEEDAANVQSVSLDLDYYYPPASAEDVIDMARSMYGVYSPEEKASDSADVPDVPVEAVRTSSKDVPDSEQMEITDPAEVAELLSLIQYARPDFRNSIVNTGVEIYYTDVEGNRVVCYMPKGVLPEKYILRFGTFFPAE